LMVSRAEDYQFTLTANHIHDREERRRQVRQQVATLSREAGGVTPDDPELVDEVADLVEWPVAVVGKFEAKYLDLPKDVLITVMKSHQRYFPVVDAGTGVLMPNFIAVANGQRSDMNLIRQGYEDVLRARYADAAFFLKQDLGQPLETLVPRLATLAFQERLGSMLDKQRRIEELTPQVAAALGLGAQEIEQARTAAALCKADLATSMVVEMTSLQGLMGREYARRAGMPEAVAEALFQHYLPRFAGDALPESRPALAIGIADRLDSLVGLFAAGLKPTGSADPFGLRRIAAGLVQILVEKKIRFDVAKGLALAARLQPLEVKTVMLTDAGTFIAERLRGLLRERGPAADVTEAVLAARSNDPYGAFLAAGALAKAVQGAEWPQILVAYARCKRLVKDQTEVFPLSPARFDEPATRGLYKAWQKVEKRLGAGLEMPQILTALEELQGPINRFFTDVMVMVPDVALRQARLALIQRIAALPDGVADLSKLHGF
jgi:glycyl-tRNA synthetase